MKTLIKKHGRHLLYTLLVAFLFCSCTKTVTNETIKRTKYVNIETEVIVKQINSSRYFSIVTIGGCEYILYDYSYDGYSRAGLTHKGNCKYCAKRSKK
jgi:hypothetical protein